MAIGGLKSTVAFGAPLVCLGKEGCVYLSYTYRIFMGLFYFTYKTSQSHTEVSKPKKDTETEKYIAFTFIFNK